MSEITRTLGLADPDAIGASEYRAIFDCVEDALSSTEDSDEIEGTRAIVLSVLDEFEGWARQMRETIAHH